MRHLAGTILAELNLSENIIMAGLGHADVKSTQIYVDKTPRCVGKPWKRLSKIFIKNGPESWIIQDYPTWSESAKNYRRLAAYLPLLSR